MEIAGLAEPVVDAGRRLRERATRRLATLEAVRDRRMVEVYATVSVSECASWLVSEGASWRPSRTDCIAETHRRRGGDVLTILRGYATVPSDEVAEVEAEP